MAMAENMNDPHKIIQEMNWLAGSWHGDFEGSEFETHYTTPRGGVIISVSKEFNSDTSSSCFFEFEKFEVKGDSVYMTPYPNGKMSDSFGMIEYDNQAQKAVFENKNHSFPTNLSTIWWWPIRWRYRLSGRAKIKRWN